MANHPFSPRSLRRALATWSLRGAGLSLLAFSILGAPSDSQARLDPYYILRGQSFGQLKPRILFAVDTSGSMTWYPSLPDTECTWKQCENLGNPSKASRLASARAAIKQVVSQTKDQAEFALMTFGHARPPASSGQVPKPCNGQPLFTNARFQWVTQTSQGVGWTNIPNPFGGTGIWQLCGDKRPYPYLRHDNLGGFAMPDDQVAVPPAAPLYKSVSTQAAFNSWNNALRKVQWFPQFMGVRTNLDCSVANNQNIVDRTFGDYGTQLNPGTRTTNVCGRDFYYWPYVDGYPGYVYYYTYSPYTSTITECYQNGSCASGATHYHMAGVNRRWDGDRATLFAPFFSQAAIDSMSIPASDKGPASVTDATTLVLGLTSPMDQGGIDAAGGTPWGSAVGDVDSYVSVVGNNVTPLPSLPNSNAAFRHSDVASYLSFIRSISEEDMCVPTVAVLISDGQPSGGEGGSYLHGRLAKLRNKLGVKTYVVGFAEGLLSSPAAYASLQGMACAAAGSNNTNNPCNGTTNYDWDTCADPDDPVGGCAWEASDPATLADALTQIVTGEISTPVPAGPSSSINEFVAIDPNDPNYDPNNPVDEFQTIVRGYTETPTWRGHVIRGACETTEDPNDPNSPLETFCTAAADPPDVSPAVEDYDQGSGCGLSRSWDAGECLVDRPWDSRLLLSSDKDDVVYRIADPDGSASNTFMNELDAQGLLISGDKAKEADAIAAFLLGENALKGWKLAGLANSTPIVVRRIPKPDESFAPSVGIRDPHCAGRLLGVGMEVSPQLQDFAADAWDETKQLLEGGGYDKHWEYEEAVLVGSDMGLLHAFHFNSGNELFAYLPPNLLAHVAELAANGPTNFGQPADLKDHQFGISSTVNQGWAYDEKAGTWRHLAVFGFGPGSPEYVVLDVAHMGRLTNGFPVEVLWSTWTVDDASWYDAYQEGLGVTWSRPALTYGVKNGIDKNIGDNPKAYLVFASGYPEDPSETYQGQTLFMVDAITGETQGEAAYFPPPTDQSMLYDKLDDYALVSDPAVATQCESGFWGEMQEVYLADAYGQLFRWDLQMAPDLSFPPGHDDDSVQAWSGNGDLAEPLFQFRACQGAGTSCAVNANNRGDVFTYAAAVVGKGRIDDTPLAQYDTAIDDRYLVALNSGSPFDAAVDAGVAGNDFHSSLYLMADEHRDPDAHAGLSVPGAGGDITLPGTHARFMRIPLSEIERTRCVYYPDDPNDLDCSDVRKFSRHARPISAPRIRVSGVMQNSKVAAELYYITYVVYEPGENACDPRWYDANQDKWVFDYGSTYEVTFRVDAKFGNNGFDFLNGSGLDLSNAGDGFTGNGLQGGKVAQVMEGDCADGSCGPQSPAPKNKPCDPNTYGVPPIPGQTIPMGWAELDGFSPLEVPLN